MASLRAAKKDLRNMVQKRLADVPGHSVSEQSITVVAALTSMPTYRAAKRIGIFLSMPKGEVQTRAIVNNALEQQKQVFVPFMHNTPGVSDGKLRKVMDMVELLSKGDLDTLEGNRDAWGIPTVKPHMTAGQHRILGDKESVARDAKPNGENWPTEAKQTEFPRGKLDMIVMPGVAFDRKCGRLGHGKGFYDLFLQRYLDNMVPEIKRDVPEYVKEMPFLVGLALNEQLLDEDQEVPADASDWRLDAVISGDGSIIVRPPSE